jgi:hypothetical protein
VPIGLPNELDNLFDIPGRYVTEESGNSNVAPLGFFCFTVIVALPNRSTFTCTRLGGDLCFGGEFLGGGELVIFGVCYTLTLVFRNSTIHYNANKANTRIQHPHRYI